MRKAARHIIRPVNGEGPKSSPEARRLIRATVKKFQSQRKAAWALRLPNQAQLNRMLNGTMHDSPAMQAALLRAKKRAERAYFFVRADHEPLDVETIAGLLHDIDEQIELLKELMKPAPPKANEP